MGVYGGVRSQTGYFEPWRTWCDDPSELIRRRKRFRVTAPWAIRRSRSPSAGYGGGLRRSASHLNIQIQEEGNRENQAVSQVTNSTYIVSVTVLMLQ